MASINHNPIRLLNFVKSAILKPGTVVRKAPIGLLAGINLEIDFATQTQLYLGLYETETFSFLRRAARRAKWMIDVGAGAGELSLFFMRDHGRNTVFAVEPSEAARAVLARNLAANGWTSDDIVIASAFAGADAAEGVVRLDDFAVAPEAPGLVKIDVDGFEVDVLNGTRRILSTRAADFLVEVHSVELEAECVSILKGHGYQVDVIPNAWWRLVVPENRPIAHNRWISASVC